MQLDTLTMSCTDLPCHPALRKWLVDSGAGKSASLKDQQLRGEGQHRRTLIVVCRSLHRLLKEGTGAKALVHFEKALMLAKFLGNRVQERRAVRGLAAAARLQVTMPASALRSCSALREGHSHCDGVLPWPGHLFASCWMMH